MTFEEIQKRNAALVEEFSELINVMGNEKELVKLFADKMNRMHRTNLQSFMGVIKELIENYATHKHSDARNESSLKWAQAVAKLKEKNEFYAFPFI